LFYLFPFVYLSVSICQFVSFGFDGGGATGERAPCGEEVLYIRGVDRLDENNKHKHFYLSTRVPHLREYPLSITNGVDSEALALWMAMH
jgi:hypothetical protein